jgi:hypothetical protein
MFTSYYLCLFSFFSLFYNEFSLSHQLCQVGELACNEDDSGGEEEKEWGKGSRKRTRGGRRSDRLALLDVGTDEASTQVSESDHHSIGSVEEQIQVQSEKEVQCLEPNELEESQTQVFCCFWLFISFDVNKV